MEINEAITLFQQASENQFVDKDDFINDCVVLFLEGLSADEAIRKTRNKKIGEVKEKWKFAKPILDDDGEDRSDDFYFVDQSTIEHNDGNTFKAKYPDAEKIAKAILLTNALQKSRAEAVCQYTRIHRCNGKLYLLKGGVWTETENHIFNRNNVFFVLKSLAKACFVSNPKKNLSRWCYNNIKRKGKRK